VLKAPPTILVVDDEESVRLAVNKFLTRLGYVVRLAANGKEALEILNRHEVACLLLDIHLPDTTGLELLPSVQEANPTATVVMLSARSDAKTAVFCMQRGVVDFVTKPFELQSLGQTLELALKEREERLAQQEMNRWLREELEQRNREIEGERLKIQRLAASALEALVQAMEAKDRFLAGHSIRVAQLAAALAAEMGRTDEEIEQLRLSGRLHDIGMIGISGEILSRPGSLTPEEFEMVKRHSLVGYQILAAYPHLDTVARFVRGHHERWDGRGYPDGLFGDNIPWGSRILAAAEIYDALTTARPYREKVPSEEALAKIHELDGVTLDPAVCQALDAVIAQRHALEFVHEDQHPHREPALALSTATRVETE
jgi:putative two-component system response regulator